MNEKLEPIEDRVNRSLQRMGYHQISVSHLGDGKIVLRGTIASPSEKSLVYSAARAVVGVAEVTNELKTSG